MKLFLTSLALCGAFATAGMAPSDPPETPKPAQVVSPFRAAPDDCPDLRPEIASGETLRPQRLGDLPPADMELAIDYREDGCPVTVVVKEDIGR